ncbi:MAG: hypothetical protein QF752_08800 [Planctomycetota bacterium]|nr:hypothetical protein [Planctomycetota bacterium]
MLTRHLTILALVLVFLSSSLVSAQSCQWDPDKKATHVKCYKFKKSQTGNILGIEEIVYKPWATKYFDYRRSKGRDVEELEQTYDAFYFLSDNLCDLDIVLELADARGRGNNALLESLEEASQEIKLKLLREEFEKTLDQDAIRTAILERLEAHVAVKEKAYSRAQAAIKKADPSKVDATDAEAWKAANATWDNAHKKLQKASTELRNARQYIHDLDKIKISHTADCIRPAHDTYVRRLGAEDHLTLQYDPENYSKVEEEDNQKGMLFFGILAGIVVLGSLLCGVIMKIIGD